MPPRKINVPDLQELIDYDPGSGYNLITLFLGEKSSLAIPVWIRIHHFCTVFISPFIQHTV